MNVKNIINSLVNIAGVSTQKLDKKTKAEASGEKDTQLGHGEEESSNHRMSEDEANEVLEYLRGLDGIKDNNLTVRLEKSEDRYVVYVEDSAGKIVRRIQETELWFLFKKRNKDSKKGQILNKAM
jgi:uncharacterized FlaG/YvyC family protein